MGAKSKDFEFLIQDSLNKPKLSMAVNSNSLKDEIANQIKKD